MTTWARIDLGYYGETGYAWAKYVRSIRANPTIQCWTSPVDVTGPRGEFWLSEDSEWIAEKISLDESHRDHV